MAKNYDLTCHHSFLYSCMWMMKHTAQHDNSDNNSLPYIRPYNKAGVNCNYVF